MPDTYAGQNVVVVPGTCSGCTLCCEMPRIVEISKPAFEKCKHVCAAGCAIHASEERALACKTFRCRYIKAHEASEAAEIAIIPHPREAAAYFFEVPGENRIVLMVSRDDPNRWKGTALAQFLLHRIDAGYTVRIVDRGYSFFVRTVEFFQSALETDLVLQAQAAGIEPNIPR